jgi:DNA-binding transcriptional regulator LsrR (DeoR family)
MAARVKRPGDLDPGLAEMGDIIEAARLFYEGRLSQKKIGRKIRGVSQGTISRWLRRAENERLVEHRVRVPTLLSLQSELREHLPERFREIRVVPPGYGKNLDNLADEAARLLVEAILDIQRLKRSADPEKPVTIDITLSSGHSLQRTCERLVEYLRQMHRKIDADLRFFPAALFWNAEIKDYYPATLVTTLWTQLHGTFADRVHAFAPMLPRSYYEDQLWRRNDPNKEEARAAALKDSGAAEVMDRATKADIIFVGIGTVDDPTYKAILESLRLENVADEIRRDGRCGGLIYVPLNDEYGVGDRIVRVEIPALARAAADPNRWVIGIAGGEHKSNAIRQVLEVDPPILNCLVTDARVASDLVRGKE